MDFYRTKQPIALPVDSEDEKLLKDGKELDPEFGVDAPPQQPECGKRCCFAKGTRGRKAIRLVGHFLILGAFLYWLWRPSVKLYRAGPNLNDIQFSDFTDLGAVPSTIPKDSLWVCIALPPNKRESLIGITGRLRFRRGIGM